MTKKVLVILGMEMEVEDEKQYWLRLATTKDIEVDFISLDEFLKKSQQHLGPKYDEVVLSAHGVNKSDNPNLRQGHSVDVRKDVYEESLKIIEKIITDGYSKAQGSIFVASCFAGGVQVDVQKSPLVMGLLQEQSIRIITEVGSKYASVILREMDIRLASQTLSLNSENLQEWVINNFPDTFILTNPDGKSCKISSVKVSNQDGRLVFTRKLSLFDKEKNEWVLQDEIEIKPTLEILNELLVLAALKNKVDDIKLLKEAGADLNCLLDGKTRSPLIQAVDSQKREAVLALLELGADPNITNKQKYSALSIAAEKGDPIIFKDLIDAGGKANDDILNIALRKKNFGTLKLIMKLLVNDDVDFSAAAIEAKIKKINRYLLKFEIAIPESKTLLLIYKPLLETKQFFSDFRDHAQDPQFLEKFFICAVKNGYLNIAQKLLDLGVNINLKDEEGLTPIRLAIDKGEVKMVEFLASKGAHLERNVIYGAAKNCNSVMITKLSELGADPNFQDESGITALHIAVANEDVDSVISLMNCKTINPNLQNDRGNSALEEALLGENKLCAKSIFEHLSSEEKITCLSTILKKHNYSQMEMLLSIVNDHVQENHSVNPMHYFFPGNCSPSTDPKPLLTQNLEKLCADIHKKMGDKDSVQTFIKHFSSALLSR